MYSVLFILILVVRTIGWIDHNFGDLTVEQILFHIQTNQGGFAQNPIDQTLLKSYVFSLAGSLVTFLALSALIYFLKLKKRFLSAPQSVRAILTVCALVLCVVMIERQIKFLGYLKTYYGEDIFSRVYVAPDPHNYNPPENAKNLVIVYVESMERTYFDPLLFDTRIAELYHELPGVEVLGFKQAPGTHWSLAGMISSSCGLPLKSFVGNNLDKNGWHHQVLPGAICLGDILQDAGYTQSFFVGSDVRFGGMDKFYLTHGFELVIGREQWRERGLSPDLMTSWDAGPHDDTVLENALLHIKTQHQQNIRFNVNISLVDNHAPMGIHSPRCTDEERHMGHRGAILCSGRAVNRFVRGLEQAGVLKDTVLIVMGDHLLPSILIDGNRLPGEREIYFKIHSPDPLPPARMGMTHFDVPATVLEVLGLSIDSGQRFGLGSSVFRESQDLWDRLAQKVLSHEILNSSDLYWSLWLSKDKDIAIQEVKAAQ